MQEGKKVAFLLPAGLEAGWFLPSVANPNPSGVPAPAVEDPGASHQRRWGHAPSQHSRAEGGHHNLYKPHSTRRTHRIDMRCESLRWFLIVGRGCVELCSPVGCAVVGQPQALLSQIISQYRSSFVDADIMSSRFLAAKYCTLFDGHRACIALPRTRTNLKEPQRPSRRPTRGGILGSSSGREEGSRPQLSHLPRDFFPIFCISCIVACNWRDRISPSVHAAGVKGSLHRPPEIILTIIPAWIRLGTSRTSFCKVTFWRSCLGSDMIWKSQPRCSPHFTVHAAEEYALNAHPPTVRDISLLPVPGK